jgi:hypothetical protein
MEVGHKQNEGGRDAEVEEIGERIELRAETGGALERARDPPVEAIENRRAGDRANRPFDRSFHGEADRSHAEAERDQRHDVGQEKAQRHGPKSPSALWTGAR